jgi:hypothetical protein
MESERSSLPGQMGEHDEWRHFSSVEGATTHPGSWGEHYTVDTLVTPCVVITSRVQQPAWTEGGTQ